MSISCFYTFIFPLLSFFFQMCRTDQYFYFSVKCNALSFIMSIATVVAQSHITMLCIPYFQIGNKKIIWKRHEWTSGRSAWLVD